MSLISLDTPQIQLLEHTRRSDPDRYGSFVRAWRARACGLVFTRTELAELCRDRNAARREGKYEVLADLAPVHTDIPLPGDRSTKPLILMHREIARAIVGRRLAAEIGLSVDHLQRCSDVLPGRIDDHVGEWLGSHESGEYLDTEDLVYLAARFAAGADRSRAEHRNPRRVRDIPSTPLTAAEVRARLEEMQKQMASPPEHVLNGDLPPIPPDILGAVAAISAEGLARSSQIGQRAWLLEKLPVTGLAEEEVLALTVEELAACFVFELMVRHLARDVLNLAEDRQSLLVRSLKLGDCPGTWIWFRLRSRVRYTTRDPRANHHYDVDRLAYLPYVDVMLTDKEMAELVRQTLRDRRSPESVRRLRPARAVPATIDDLERALDW